MNLASIDSPMAIPAVWGCVALIANTISMLPLETFKKKNDRGVALRADDPPLLQKPGSDLTLSEWIHAAMVSVLLRGNTLGQIGGFDSRGYPNSVNLLNPDTVGISVNRETGVVEYRFTDPSGKPGAVHHEWRSGLANADIWHMRGMMMPGIPIGLSPIAYAALTLGVDVNSREFAGNFFEGSQMPKAVLETDQEVNQSQAQTIKDRITASMQGRAPIVLGAGLKFVPITIKPNEAQFLETQGVTGAQVCRFFSVAPEMLGYPAGHSMTYANEEQRSLDFLKYCVGFWLRRIEDALYQLLPGKQFVKFEPNELLRTDAMTAASIRLQELAGKLRTPTEIREQDLNLPEMTEEQKEEINLVPLDMNVIGGSKLGVKVNNTYNEMQNPGVANPSNTGKPAEPTPGEDEK
ncbi:phage portal protein [Nocardia sp. NPDC058058]|uniref:phage portal protein n=1 Tax=Nocardia sp. NPDC058058 TaxID=3346317 RepID=UPI0036DBB739